MGKIWVLICRTSNDESSVNAIPENGGVSAQERNGHSSISSQPIVQPVQ